MMLERDRGAMWEYIGVDHLEGPLAFIEGASDVGYDEVGEVIAPDGSVRLGQVLEVSENLAVLQLFDESDGLRPSDLRVRFRGRPMRVPVAREMLGRVFDGLGNPRDGLPPPIAEERVLAQGAPLNPEARAYPRDYIVTGISTIDGMNTLVRGQKLPIFSGEGLPHNELAAQIASQARLAEEGEEFAIVFVALGVSHDVARVFERTLTQRGTSRVALFLNLADDPPIERTITPRMALSLAEFLAFERDMHVLVILTDITNYGEAVRELALRREEVPTRKGFPGHYLLDRKREVLMRALFDRFEDAEAAEQKARERFKTAYDAISKARMDIGVDRLRWISLAPSAEIHVKVRNRSIMGVIAALVEVDVKTLPIPYGPGDTDVSMDRAHQQWLQVARLLGRLAETTVTVWRLAIELRKTQRRVNALQEIMIPRYEATISHISDSLEEKEQEEVVHAKKVKRLHKESESKY